MSVSSCENMIPPPTKIVKLSEGENEDRLSDLPDCIILHILSFLNARNAVQTCVLSTRWKDLWKRLKALKLHSSDFPTLKIFTKFVSKILSLRDSSSTLQALDLKRNSGRFEPHLLKRIVNYAISHNVQQFGLQFGLRSTADIAQVPPTLFSSQTLTYLKLTIYPGIGRETLFPKSLKLPALTTLQLGFFTFCVGDNDCAEPFSTFNRLNSLFISCCTVKGTQTLCISSATLVNLTMNNHKFSCSKFIDLCTPSLCTFTFTGYPDLKLSGRNVSSLKHVDIDAEVYSYRDKSIFFLFSWLKQLANIKSLTVSAKTLQVLSFIPDLSKINFPSLGNLKYLRVEIEEISYGFRMTLCDFKLQKVKTKKEAALIRETFLRGMEPFSPIPDGIVDFLLQGLPSAKVDFIDCSGKHAKERYL